MVTLIGMVQWTFPRLEPL